MSLDADTVASSKPPPLCFCGHPVHAATQLPAIIATLSLTATRPKPALPYRLARRNAEDMLLVQPPMPGVPYLLGGHSYGGVVAMEIALLLESWGHDVGMVLVRVTQTMSAQLLKNVNCCSGHAGYVC